MPCRSDYMEPNHKEKQLQTTCKLIVFVSELKDIECPTKFIQGAKDPYCRVDGVAALCALINNFTEEEYDQIMYNGRNKTSRDLANWWDVHYEADRLRKIVENEKALQRKVKAHALSKLTREEIEALGLA